MFSTTREEIDLKETGARRGPPVLSGVASLTDDGIRIRQMDDVDLGRVLELRSLVRWAADPGSFELLRGMCDARWAVAEAPDGALAGMVGAVPLGEVGILCHLAVHDAYRQAGLGSGLTAWAVAYLRSRGARTVRLYSTQQAEKLYRSAGFESAAPRTVYRLEGEPGNLRARDGGHRVETLTIEDLPELYGVDRWAYGADRSALILLTLRLHPGRGLVARDPAGRIKGYLIRSSSPRATRIGPFVAATTDVALLLMARALGDGDGPFEVVVPDVAGDAAHPLFREFGFSGHEDRLRMELGRTLDSHPKGLTHYGTTPYLAT